MSKKLELNPQQLAAIMLKDNTAILASAGTGKTHVLVECYLRLLGKSLPKPVNEENSNFAYSPKELVAITYTDKAAGEMKVRVRKAIEQMIREAKSDKEQRYWENCYSQLDEAQISTIHSFCSRILREYPVEARIDPDFEVIEEEQAEEILENIIKKKIITGFSTYPALKTLLLTINFQEYTFTPGLIGLLRNIITEIRVKDTGFILNPGTPLEYFTSKIYNRKRIIKGAFESIQDFYEGIYKETFNIINTQCCGKTSSKTCEKIKKFNKIWGEYFRNRPYDEFNISERDIYLNELQESFHLKWSRLKGAPNVDKNDVDTMRSYLAYKDEFVKFQKVHEQVLGLTIEILTAYEWEKQRLSVLDYDDLQIKALRLLKYNPEVLKKYQREIKYLLVDEYQDVNPVQGELVRALTFGEFVEKGSEPELPANRLFIVGDKKQSIYRFRGADVTVFDNDMKLMKREQVIPLNVSYRSRPEIVEFVNRIFSGQVMVDLDEKTDYDIDYNDGDRTHFLEPYRESTREIAVEYLNNDDQNHPVSGIDERRKIEGEAIARRIKHFLSEKSALRKPRLEVKGKIRDTIQPKDIAILLQKSKNAEYIELALEKEAIPYMVIGGKDFYRKQEIFDLYNFLNFLTYQDNVSLVGVLRSPFVGLSDSTIYRLFEHNQGNWNSTPGKNPGCFEDMDTALPGIAAGQQEQLKRFQSLIRFLKRNKDQLSLSQLFDLILERTDYLAVNLGTFRGEVKYANIQKLKATAQGFEGKGTPLLRDFVDFLRTKIEGISREPKAQITDEYLNVVKIMTIHQAKGLEFPIVFIPDTGMEIKNKVSDILYSPDYGILITMDIAFDDRVEEKQKSPLVPIAKSREYREELAESKRKFYVACTRAMDYLVFSGGNPNNKSSWYNNWIKPFMEIDNAYPLIEEVPYSKITTIENEKSPIWELDEQGQLILNDYDTSLEIPPSSVSILKGEKYEPPLSEISLSATKLLDFIKCERYYYNKYILCLSSIVEFKKGLLNEHGGGDFLEAGNFAHRVMERIDFKDPDLLNQVKRIIEIEKAHFRLAEDELNSIGSDLTGFLQSGFVNLVADAKIMEREWPFMAKLGKYQEVPILFEGKMDLIFSTPAGKWGILEYKYARKKSADTERYRLQLLLYGLILIEQMGLNGEIIELYLAHLRERGAPPEAVGDNLSTDPSKYRQFFLELAWQLGQKQKRDFYSSNNWEKRAWSLREGIPVYEICDKDSCANLKCDFYEKCWGEDNR
ncbi:UvrD-helicase domain-containing protein [bacterium]|nr:UvrD-helicase domain-containing protein [bacterium]